MNDRQKLVQKPEVKILVVDDREDNLFSIETILEQDGYKIVKANSGRAALKVLLHHDDFTLILMDVQMPDMNGFETATLIYEGDKLKHIPIIFITAHDYSEEFLFKGYTMGAIDYIYKPINPQLLRFKVGVFVELYQKNHQLLQQEKKLKAINISLQKEIEERKTFEQKIKLLNQQLLQNNAELKATNEELDRFAYIASHDLQEPLRKIQIFSDKINIKLNEGNNRSEIEDHLNKIVKSSQRMQSLITDLLKFSRHTTSQDNFELIDLNTALREVLQDLELEIQRKQAIIQLRDLPQIWAIPTQMRQLFQNLISNSLKFSKKDSVPTIEIFSEKIGQRNNGLDSKPDENTYYKIFIKDNGIGFDSKYSDEIFVVFKRLHSYHEFEGTGIGLSICKKIVERHNGKITAMARINEGATFVLTMPKKQSFEKWVPATN